MFTCYTILILGMLTEMKKSLLSVFQDGKCHPKMALVIDDRLTVWDLKDKARVHIVPAFAPYYAPQAEVCKTVNYDHTENQHALTQSIFGSHFSLYYCRHCHCHHHPFVHFLAGGEFCCCFMCCKKCCLQRQRWFLQVRSNLLTIFIPLWLL